MTMTKFITTTQELVNVFATAKASGQYASATFETKGKLNKYPTDGSIRERVDNNFADGLTKVSKVVFHFDDKTYEAKMAEALGVDTYKADGSNRRHLVSNVLMQYVSTGNVCLITLPSNVQRIGFRLNGEELSEEQEAYRLRYTSKAKPSASPVKYLTVGVKNLKEVTFGGQTYIIRIDDLEGVA